MRRGARLVPVLICRDPGEEVGLTGPAIPRSRRSRLTKDERVLDRRREQETKWGLLSETLKRAQGTTQRPASVRAKAKVKIEMHNDDRLVEASSP